MSVNEVNSAGSAARQVLIIFNPASGKGNVDKVQAVKQLLQQQGCSVELYLTKSAGDATRYLEQYDGALDIIAAAGGDGTVNEVVNGLKGRANGSYQLAIIPTGTTNVLAAELGFPKSAKKIAEIILSNQIKPIYLGSINQRRFVLMAGVGYDAWVVDTVNLALKKKVGKLAYVWSMIKQLKNFGSKAYRVVIDGIEYNANSIVITNGRYYGGSFVLSREAELSSSTTQIMMISGNSPLKFFGILLGLPFGLMEKMPGTVSVAGKHIEITDHDAGASLEPVQADGDSLTQLPLELKMEEDAVQLLVK